MVFLLLCFLQLLSSICSSFDQQPIICKFVHAHARVSTVVTALFSGCMSTALVGCAAVSFGDLPQLAAAGRQAIYPFYAHYGSGELARTLYGSDAESKGFAAIGGWRFDNAFMYSP